MSKLRAAVSMVVALGAAVAGTSARAAAQGEVNSLRLSTLREVLASYDVPLGRGAPGDSERRLPNYAVEDSPELFVIAFYAQATPDGSVGDTLRVSAFDPRTRSWVHASLDRQRTATPTWDVGSILEIHHTARHILLDTHQNPSAGTVVALTRRLVPVATLDGWVTRALPQGIVLYQRSSVHFAPTHSVELWTWDERTGRDVRLYPSTRTDSVRRAYVDTVRAIYRRVGEPWFRANNHHMDPERFDTRLVDSVFASESGRELSFLVRYGGGEGTPALTPALDVVVKCRDVGLARADCTETPLSTLARRHPGWLAEQIVSGLVRTRPIAVPPPRTRQAAVTLEPLVGSRVRFRTHAGSAWRYGMMNRTRTEPGCFMIQLWANRRFTGQVPIDSVTALQVSSLGATARRYDEGDSTSDAGERWLDVPAETAAAAATRCARRVR